MKFIHLADCHIGDNFNFSGPISKKIRRANKDTFYKILKANTDVDFVLIAGDLFERDYFSLSEFKELFKKLAEFKKDIFYLAGNHDYLSTDLLNILESGPDNLHVFGSDDLEFFEIGRLRVYGVSYNDRIFSKDINLNIDLDDEFFNILMLHGDINNPGSKYLNMNQKLLKSLGFDYIGLGHIHKWEKISNNIYYAGSIEPHDFSDLYDYGYILYDEGKISHKDFSSLKFYDLDLDFRDFADEKELISYLKEILSDRNNFLRLKINKDIKENFLKNNLNISYLDLRVDMGRDYDVLLNLYPNSLLERYKNKFKGNLDEIEQMALSIGMDAIFRSKDD